MVSVALVSGVKQSVREGLPIGGHVSLVCHLHIYTIGGVSLKGKSERLDGGGCGAGGLARGIAVSQAHERIDFASIFSEIVGGNSKESSSNIAMEVKSDESGWQLEIGLVNEVRISKVVPILSP